MANVEHTISALDLSQTLMLVLLSSLFKLFRFQIESTFAKLAVITLIMLQKQGLCIGTHGWEPYRHLLTNPFITKRAVPHHPLFSSFILQSNQYQLTSEISCRPHNYGQLKECSHCFEELGLESWSGDQYLRFGSHTGMLGRHHIGTHGQVRLVDLIFNNIQPISYTHSLIHRARARSVRSGNSGCFETD
ncbi:hypothetical protein LguiB_032127 [Lonicera macranthoides]